MASKVPGKVVPGKSPSSSAKTKKVVSTAGTTTSTAGAATTSGKKVGAGSAPTKGRVGAQAPGAAHPAMTKGRPVFVPRGLTSNDELDVLMAHGGGGSGFGRCGGRLLSGKLEQQLCQRLGIAGVVHSHSPRHYEVRFPDGQVAAYAPMVVLRSRGREGKTVVIEAIEDVNSPMLRKIVAFRGQYGAEFYIIVVATDEVLDEIPLATYDESCSVVNVSTLVARLAE